jgi:hypothetical protein
MDTTHTEVRVAAVVGVPAAKWLRHIYSDDLLARADTAAAVRQLWESETIRFGNIARECADPMAQLDRTCTQHGDSGQCEPGRAAYAAAQVLS